MQKRDRFYNIGNVETNEAIEALGALAQASRLTVFRLLVKAGEEGLAAGAIAAQLGVPPATLSFHLAHLARAGLVRSRQDGRYVIYRADFASMAHLLQYLTEDCCGGKACLPAGRRKAAA